MLNQNDVRLRAYTHARARLQQQPRGMHNDDETTLGQVRGDV